MASRRPARCSPGQFATGVTVAVIGVVGSVLVAIIASSPGPVPPPPPSSTPAAIVPTVQPTPSPTQPGPTQPGPTQPGPTQPGPTQPGPTPEAADLRLLDVVPVGTSLKPSLELKLRNTGDEGAFITRVDVTVVHVDGLHPRRRHRIVIRNLRRGAPARWLAPNDDEWAHFARDTPEQLRPDHDISGCASALVRLRLLLHPDSQPSLQRDRDGRLRTSPG